ncbi:Glutathione amide reductase [Synechococcus sp. MIT S9509]|uniref:glutathione-disulfide reductase n=1 Tax=unclassified Synechococcus TaxID=2626047 RepID=UPI0007BC5AEA|nr:MULTISPECIES: glutathione-disulfide reductase [unclassified Synechococcus]KZR86805.1 Glutathione amide reductase [Synechococcus sp. MIT S9504]KZR92875.1 Glutathione amide reductase [Synechococcus sp. MIT S9509]
MDQSFDLVVIGAGSGGLAAAKRAARHGARVAIVEGDRVGGTCVIRGCVPKKLLVYGSQMAEQMEEASSYGVHPSDVRIDSAQLLANVRAEVDRLNAMHIDFLAKAEVTLIKGWARFEDDHHIVVSADPGGAPEQRLHAERVLIGVGGRPQRPDIPGVELGWVSDDMFLLERFPERMVVVGAGFIACEFAGILSGLGVEVTQLVRRDHLLRGFDAELAAVVQEGMAEKGVNVQFSTGPEAIEGNPGDLVVRTNRGDQIACGGVLLATGRRPFLQGLNLEAAGVTIQGNRVPVDADQRTNVPHVFAVGDVTDRICLTPVAIDEGRAFADSVYGDRPRQVDHELVASAVFSQPELATVGLSEEEAIAQYGADGVVVYRARFRSMAQALPKRGPRCLLKLVLEVETERVLGCHMVGEHAAEIIQMAAIAVGMGATKSDFDRTMALHPTVSEEFVTMG